MINLRENYRCFLKLVCFHGGFQPCSSKHGSTGSDQGLFTNTKWQNHDQAQPDHDQEPFFFIRLQFTINLKSTSHSVAITDEKNATKATNTQASLSA